MGTTIRYRLNEKQRCAAACDAVSILLTEELRGRWLTERDRVGCDQVGLELESLMR